MDPAKAPAPAPAPEPAGQPPKLSPGIATLLRTGNGAAKNETLSPVQPCVASPRLSTFRRLLRVSLVLADVLLLCLAVRMVLSAQGPIPLWGLVLCIVAFALGAWLSCLALWV